MLTELELYLIVGGLFFLGYGWGLWDEQRQRTKEISDQKRKNIEMINRIIEKERAKRK